MRTFAEKPKATQQATSPKAKAQTRSYFGHNRDVHSILHLQRIIGNQAVPRLVRSNAEECNVVSSGTNSPHFDYDFNRIPATSCTVGAIQMKLAINKPGDEYEQEADRVAERVMRMPEPRLQRAYASDGACPECETVNLTEKREQVQTKRFRAGDTEKLSSPPIVSEVLKSPGQPLDSETRGFMETRFSHDFSRVRVHTDSQAAKSALAVNALAYTVGRDVVFRAGQFEPRTVAGRRLLAHELTHVVQQSGGTRVGPRERLANPSAVTEGTVTIAGKPGRPVVQRDWALPTSGCATPIQPLTQAQVQNAIQHSQSVLSDGSQVAYARDVIGISRNITIIDQDFVNALLQFQTCFGLVQTGMLDHATAEQLFQEIIHEVVAMGKSTQIADETMLSLLRYIIGVERLRADMVAVARTEYANWNQGAALESDPAQLNELQTYWSSISNNPNPLATQSANDITPWSAAFISHVVTSAAPPDVRTMGFAPAAGHITYIREALRNRECPGTQRCQDAAQVTGHRFLLYRPTEVAPLAGDLICKNRGNSNFSYNGLQQSVCANGQCLWGQTHCDIVEQVRPNQHVVTIGGNTANTLGVQTPAHTVGARDLAINQAGLLTNVNGVIGIIRVV